MGQRRRALSLGFATSVYSPRSPKTGPNGPWNGLEASGDKSEGSVSPQTLCATLGMTISVGDLSIAERSGQLCCPTCSSSREWGERKRPIGGAFLDHLQPSRGRCMTDVPIMPLPCIRHPAHSPFFVRMEGQPVTVWGSILVLEGHHPAQLASTSTWLSPPASCPLKASQDFAVLSAAEHLLSPHGAQGAGLGDRDLPETWEG